MDYTNQNNSSSYRHTHNGIDSEKIPKASIVSTLGGKQSALTAANNGSLSSSDATIIANMRTRINELEARLQSLGLIS